MTHPIDITNKAKAPRKARPAALSARAGIALALFVALAGASLLPVLLQDASGWSAAAGLLLAAAAAAVASMVADAAMVALARRRRGGDAAPGCRRVRRARRHPAGAGAARGGGARPRLRCDGGGCRPPQGGPCRRGPARAGRQSRQVAVPGQYEPRAAHAAQRHHRLRRADAAPGLRAARQRQVPVVHRRHPALRASTC